MPLKSSHVLLPIVLLGAPLLGQEAVDFEPVEASVADVSVLGTSLRVEDPGLAPGTGFRQVYQVPGSPTTHFRASGGLYAVFDQSVYLSWNGMNFPDIPPSTTFYIGAPEFLLTRSGAAAAGSSGLSATARPSGVRRDARSSGQPGSRPGYGYVPPAQSLGTDGGNPADSIETSLPRFHTDAAYRSRRLTEIRLKCAAARSHPSPHSTP